MITAPQYVNLEEANAYFLRRLYSGLWGATNPTDRNASLIQATRIIDRLNFEGSKTDVAQLTEFPRSGDTEIPSNIKVACNEIAFCLLDGIEPEMETENLSMVSEGYSSVRTTHDRQIAQQHLAAGVPSIIAWRKLLPFLRDSNNIKLRRLS